MIRRFAFAAVIALGACTDVPGANPRVAQAYGFNDAAAFEGAVLSIGQQLNRYNCGSAMTREACRATQANFLALLPQNLNQIKSKASAFVVSKYGSPEAAIAAVRGQSATDQARELCVGPVTVQCAGLFDAMFGGGILLPILDQARGQANAQVPQFYKDGRPFNG